MQELQMNVLREITFMFIQQGNLDLLIPVTHITGDVSEIGSQFPIHVFSGVVLQRLGM